MKEFDTVRVTKVSGQRTSNGDERVYREPQVGDIGAIVLVYTRPYPGYCVECVDTNGYAVWIADFTPDELELIWTFVKK